MPAFAGMTFSLLLRLAVRSTVKTSIMFVAVAGVLLGCGETANQMRIKTPDAAIATARAAWKSIDEDQGTSNQMFSTQSIASLEPYTATLSGGVWTVHGTAPAASKGGASPITTVRADNGKVMVGFIAEPPTR
ncbi:MAG: hypothetical protein ACT4QA_10415 [Panacagrimonas sp.]